MKAVLLLTLFTLCSLFFSEKITAQDWTQWRGENREGIQKEKGINLDWAEKKPQVLWVYKDAGVGYSSPIISGNTLYLLGAANNNDFAFALDAKTSRLIWTSVLGELYVQDRGDGPRGTMTLDNGKLYLIRGAGQIHCISAEDGKMIWQKDLVKDFDGKIMSQWGYSESPLIDGNLVICTPGGSQGTMVALDKNSGEVVWICNEWTDEAGYSSPIVAEIDGVRQYIQQSNKGVAGVAAIDGKLLWRIEVEGYRTAVIPTPICHENIVYVTAGYGAGCTAIKLSKADNKFDTEIVYNNKNMVNHHGGVVLFDGHIYGFCDQSGWKCQNLKTGETIWNTGRTSETAGIGKGAVLGINDRLILLEERSGLMVVAAASPEGWKEFGRIEIPARSEIETKDKMVWTHPVIANGMLYLRDQDLLFCFEL